MQEVMTHCLSWFDSPWDRWVAFGLLGQGLFTGRFIYQWIVSERANKSVVPEGFWYLSLIGGAITLLYALHKHDIVCTLGQSGGVLVYVRNIHMIWRAKKSEPLATAIAE